MKQGLVIILLLMLVNISISTAESADTILCRMTFVSKTLPTKDMTFTISSNEYVQAKMEFYDLIRDANAYGDWHKRLADYARKYHANSDFRDGHAYKYSLGCGVNYEGSKVTIQLGP